MSKTIFALSSGAGVAGVAVIRISGPCAGRAFAELATDTSLEPGRVRLVRLCDPKTEILLDRAIALFFKGPNSFTGEDVVELHVHGGVAVVEAILGALSNIDGLRQAEAGEFTRRAFDNGKLDLTEAEGLADLLAAQTEGQRQQAIRQMDGALRARYEGWRKSLIQHLAHLEADIDFPDEDLPEGVAGAVRGDIMAIREDILDHLNSAHQGRAVRHGYRIVILGEPNAGKSTLLNALAKTDVAIVSDKAGTTRDAIEVQLNLGGFPVRLIDTAGLRDGGGEIEQEGMRRARSLAGDAELRLVLLPAGKEASVASQELINENTLVVFTKCDQAEPHDMKQKACIDQVRISAKSGVGVDKLLDILASHVTAEVGAREAAPITRLRHKRALEDVAEHLRRFNQNAGLDPVLAAEDVRMAARAVGSITGMVHVEEILDVVFSDFCIGK